MTGKWIDWKLLLWPNEQESVWGINHQHQEPEASEKKILWGLAPRGVGAAGDVQRGSRESWRWDMTEFRSGGAVRTLREDCVILGAVSRAARQTTACTWPKRKVSGEDEQAWGWGEALLLTHGRCFRVSKRSKSSHRPEETSILFTFSLLSQHQTHIWPARPGHQTYGKESGLCGQKTLILSLLAGWNWACVSLCLNQGR